MAPTRAKLILWVGRKHTGKTTAAAELVTQARADGFRVAGVLAPAIHRGEVLTGFDLVDLRIGTRTPLARRGGRGAVRVGAFAFAADGLERGHRVLTSVAAHRADLVIVDEFGGLEWRGQGWRQAVDDLLESAVGVILLVVRERLAERVGRLYAGHHPAILPASRRSSVDSVLASLKKRATRAKERAR